ncbi:MAG: ribulose-phosphate 3-epimerase [Candidatus Hodarchaeales archaeon]
MAPSILSADFVNIAQEISEIEPYVRWLHIDIMDGIFVPNITIGPNVIKSIRKISKLKFDIHLMIQNPTQKIDTFIDSGADNITIHVEAEKKDNIIKIIDKIHSRGKKAGLSIKPKTPVSSLFPYIKIIDTILCMTVEPGFGGQIILTETINKIRDISRILLDSKSSIVLQVDGGINKKTAPLVVEAGATFLVVGSAIFKQKNHVNAINEILEAIRSS